MENHDKDENSRNSQVNAKDSGNSDSGKARYPQNRVGPWTVYRARKKTPQGFLQLLTDLH